MNCNELKNLIDIKEKAILEHDRQEAEKAISVKKEFELIKGDLLGAIIEVLVDNDYKCIIGIRGLYIMLPSKSSGGNLKDVVNSSLCSFRSYDTNGWFLDHSYYNEFRELLMFLKKEFNNCEFDVKKCIPYQETITIISSKEELLKKFCCNGSVISEPKPEFVPPPPLIRINKTPLIEINNTSTEKDGVMWFVMGILFIALIIGIVSLINI